MFSTHFIFRQQEHLVENQKCQAGFRPLCNKILLFILKIVTEINLFIFQDTPLDGAKESLTNILKLWMTNTESLLFLISNQILNMS